MILLRAIRLLWSAAPSAMVRGAFAGVLVMAMGAALLGLSGWFITATGAAGLMGVGIAFDVFRPSAGIRFLALGRAAGRYAERLWTHDATLRALARLRVVLMADFARKPMAELRRLRGSALLVRITADVDALDGVLLRLVLPLLAGLASHALAFALLWWLVAPQIAGAVALGYLLGGAVVFARLIRRSTALAAQAETQAQTLRRQMLGLIRGQRGAILQGTLPQRAAEITQTETTLRAAHDTLDRAERNAAMGLSAVVAVLVALVLWLADGLVQNGALSPAPAALGLFAALALAETLLPLRRGVAEIGRIQVAARRILGTPIQTVATPPAPHPTARGLVVRDLTVPHPARDTALIHGLSLDVAPGKTVALRSPSGSGKSTLLDALAGLHPATGDICLNGLQLNAWPEREMRAILTLVPQRTALIGGTIRDNLALATDDSDDDQAAWNALEAVALDDVIRTRGGLDARLGEGGAGLSGGESRRLALARAILRKPMILLLDEPTEGLDAPLARRVLHGIRTALPEAAILTASHREAETQMADQTIDLQSYI
ncbi:ATP-binding cassette, subfamily C, CydC [Tropicibacter naphthalenivorans]|uniref:Putative ABC transporter ATP-binding protein n=1 Tax=Tropicibacter naphthalenivorans TaxID=441103 RepID=A0A0N7LYM7_9RHOB|nr:ATP-binding cassette domain-containing protein [Tropicibacter naphthalenivorans]CUH75297.1 putative ABC transporter ATP-binding protein [Tropicibacter naphthalenivorans]SMC45178.1 ATP-binding cassette, subfamily C, CydC [Tropicibacter naphthalenivorans]